MIKKLAVTASLIFHPLLMPTFLFGIIFLFSPELMFPHNNDVAKWQVMLAIFIMTFCVPVIILVLLNYSGQSRQDFLNRLSMPRRQERIIPFAFVALFYGIASYLFIIKLEVNEYFSVIILGITSLILVLAIITIFFKISAHSTGICGLAGFLSTTALKFEMYQLVLPIAMALVIGGAVMSARLYLNAHKPAEVWLGSILGILTGFGAWFFI